MTRLLGSAFGLGLLPVAPGTFGTLLGVALALVLPYGWPVAAAAGAVFLLGVPLARAAERLSGKDDPSWFVLDEVAGYLAVVLWIEPVWWRLAAGFALFRAFDIGKPWPIRRAERLPHGWGVMADDVVAAAYAHVLLRLIP